MENKHKLLLFLFIFWSVVASLLSIYQWKKNQRVIEVNAALTETLATTRYLAENGRALGSLLKECLDNDSCYSQETASKFNILRLEKEALSSKLKELEKEFKSLR